MGLRTGPYQDSELETLRARVVALQAACDSSKQAQHEADQFVRTLIEHAPEAIVLINVETGLFVDANPMAQQLFGLPLQSLLEMGPFQLSPPLQPDGPSPQRGNERIAEAVNGDVPVFEWWHCHAQGERFPCEVRLVRIPWHNREVIRGTIVDISARKQLELSELGRRRILKDMVRGVSLNAALETLVRTVEQVFPGMICSILLLDRKTNRLRHGAAPSLPDCYNAAVEGLAIGPAVGSCGAAAFTGQRVIVSDVAHHPNWAGFQQLTEKAQLKSCWSEPVVSLSGDVLGSFAMYYREPREPAPVELQAIEAAAQMAAIVIDRGRAQESLQELNETLERRVAEETKHLSTANQKLRAIEQDVRLAAVAFDTHDSIVITSKSGKIIRVNKSFTKLTGYTPKDVVGKTPRMLRSGRHGTEFYGEMWRSILEEGYWEGEVWNRRKDGQVYLQHLTIACVKNETGETTHYVGDGRDVTQQRQAVADGAAIAVARTVQRGLFPLSPPRVPGFDLAGDVHPAESVSGDFFDYLSLGQNSVGVLVADVSGHGLGPALLMAQMQAYLRALAESHADPGELLTRANRLFATKHTGHFVTMFLGCLNAETRSFIYAGAGHRGYLISSCGAIQMLHSTSMPVGIEETTVTPSASAIFLEPGDILVVPTDGIEEAMNLADAYFGEERMLDVVRDNRSKTAAQIVNALFDAARDFAEGRPQKDDITVVVVKVLEPGELR